jgi:hypothetical protein
MPSENEKRKSGVWTLRNRFIYGTWLAVIALLWATAWHVFASAPATDTKEWHLVDRTTLGLNALGLVLVLATLVIGAGAIFGWQKLEDTIRRDIEGSTAERFTKLQTEVQGRLLSVLGYTLGTLSSEPDRLEPTNPARLSEALWNCEKGYELLKEIGGKPMFLALNNLVYFGCVRGAEADGRRLLQQARLLRQAGDEYGSPQLLLTFSRAVLQYSTDPGEIEEARAIASEVLSGSGPLTADQQKEARFYLASESLSRRGKDSVREQH